MSLGTNNFFNFNFPFATSGINVYSFPSSVREKSSLSTVPPFTAKVSENDNTNLLKVALPSVVSSNSISVNSKSVFIIDNACAFP